MTWLSNIFHQHEAPQSDDEVLKKELLRLGVDLEVPGLVRSTSSNTSLESSSGDSLCSLEKQPSLPLHSIGEPNKCPNQSKEASFLEVLQGLNHAVEAHCQAKSKIDPSDEGDSVNNDAIPADWFHKAPTSPPVVPRRRIVCPNFVEKEAPKDIKKDLSKLTFRSPSMQTYPKSSVRMSRFSFGPRQTDAATSAVTNLSKENKSVSFSPKVHVLEFERECVQHSSPGWWNFFS